MAAEKKVVVYVIDDDPSVRYGLSKLMDAYGLEARFFESAREFLAAAGVQPRGGHAPIRGLPGDNSCIVIDVAMPDMNGLELQEELTRAGCKAPVIFFTALNDPDVRERAKLAGAAGFFQKPVDAGALLDAIKWAVAGKKEERGTRGEGVPSGCQ